ncbi:hypothetical protein D9757_003827 [Collybiopsis confluens]|uniref:RING-type domain-containing protein n=1 Tax=Collybiopsis confluens TaxID=2823264 RepID=A0A8H5HVJ3_9AGAR|nr:hypothetical protein D9757_003827 [Collybiopsis confluens]
MSAPPATPQRTASHIHSHSVSVVLPSGRSPASPYTPLSLRSFASASTSPGSLNPSPSSTLATPASARNLSPHNGFSSPVVRVKKLSWASPSPAGHSPSDSLPSIADLARNWRSRASENGIKVSNTSKQILSDEYSLLDEADVSLTSEAVYEDDEEGLLPAPFMSTQLRRRAVSHAGLASQYSAAVLPTAPQSAPRPRTRPPLAPLSPVIRRMPPSSPVQMRRPSLINQSVLVTPPPNRHLAERLRFKGSLTEPPQPRKREALDSSDVSFDRDLFDIHEDENDEQYELEYDSYHHDLHDFHYPEDHGIVRETQSDFEEEQYEVEYPTLPLHHRLVQPLYPQYQFQQQQLPPPSYPPPQPTYSQPAGLAQPAAMRGPAYSVGQMLGHPVYHQPHLMPQYPMHPMGHLAPAHMPIPRYADSLPASSNAPSEVSTPIPPAYEVPDATTIPKICSICDRRPPSLTRLAILTPCGHALCPGCLTSALNIVGEKDMECAGCRAKVVDFKLISIGNVDGATEKMDQPATIGSTTKSKAQIKVQPSVEKAALWENLSIHGFDTGTVTEDFFSDEGMRASTPPPKAKGMHRASGVTKIRDFIVLRIDNVPWDITPPRISAWLGQPIIRVHVLLDKKGKTASHAFVEVENETMAGKILRGEVSTGARRSSVLGKGKRARGVTVTRSSQGELMSALFPSWLGTFDGSRPSLAGVESSRVVASLERGLITESEVASLLYLIRSPDAHFLKVPSLPFHSLASVLAKFPADVDSRVFWSGSLRDVLFDVVFAAIQVLVIRVEQQKAEDDSYPLDLVETLTNIALECQAFTAPQKAQITSFFSKEPARPSSASSYGSHSSRNHASPGSADPADADVEDEDGENDDDRHASSEETRSSSDGVTTPGSVTAANSPIPITLGNDAAAASSDLPSAQDASLDDLAREFGVEAGLVEALLQRLSRTQR